VFKKFLSRLTL